MPCVLGRHEVDIAQNFERAQGDIAQISNWRRDNIKHPASSDQNWLCAIACAQPGFGFQQSQTARAKRISRKETFMKMSICSLALPLALIGCAETPPPVTTTTTVTREVTTTGPTTGEVLVAQAPPAVRVETQTVAPGPTYIWIKGHWQWNGARYVWVRGHWIERPRPAAVY